MLVVGFAAVLCLQPRLQLGDGVVACVVYALLSSRNPSLLFTDLETKPTQVQPRGRLN